MLIGVNSYIAVSQVQAASLPDFTLDYILQYKLMVDVGFLEWKPFQYVGGIIWFSQHQEIRW